MAEEKVIKHMRYKSGRELFGERKEVTKRKGLWRTEQKGGEQE